MKKTLIAAAVAAAVAAPAANAGVVIYGQLHIALDYLDADLSTSGVSKVWEVNSRTSRIGFKGSEDLGNGLKAIWKLENTVRITDTGSTFGSHNGARGHWGSARNAYVGLASDWGTVLVGRHDTPYKMGFYSTGIDMLGDSIIDANSMYGIVEVRADNAIAYVSPNMNGLTVAAAIVPGEGYTNPVTGDFETLPAGYDIDPSRFFDPENGWQPLLADLRDVELVGIDDRGGERYHVRGTAPAAQVRDITVGLERAPSGAPQTWSSSAQVPASHQSSVQMFPSSQLAMFARKTQPRSESQPSSVQRLE